MSGVGTTIGDADTEAEGRRDSDADKLDDWVAGGGGYRCVDPLRLWSRGFEGEARYSSLRRQSPTPR